MGTLILHILVVAIGTVVGAIAGWFLRAMSPTKAPELAPWPQAEPGVTPTKTVEPEKTLDHVDTLMARLHQLTASVAADVGEHSSRVQAINNELSSGGDVVSVVDRLIKANEQMQSQLQAAEQRMQQQAKEMESHVKDAHTDALTKLANRRAFDDEIRHCVEAFETNDQPSCVMMIDVDHFKKFNDTYGHQAGDEVLRNVGRVLRRETTGEEIVCRYGGEEFAVIFPGLDVKAAIPRAEKSRAAIAQEVVEFQGMDLRVAASGGLAQLQPGESGETLVKRADVALYVCKENGRNCGYWHDGTTSKPMKATSTPAPAAAAPSVSSPAPAPKAVAPSAPTPEPVPKVATSAAPTPAPASTVAVSAVSSPALASKVAAPAETPPALTSVAPVAPVAPPAPTNEPEESVFKFSDETEAPKIHRRDRVGGLSDYATFCRDIDRRLAEHQRDGGAASLVFLTVDGCQQMTDSFGIRAVELALRATATIVKATMRQMDHAARYDENVFALMLPGAGTTEASAIAERIRAAVEASKSPVNGQELQFTISLGVAEFRRPDEREQLFERANQSLQAALNAGGNQTMAAGEDEAIHSAADSMK